MLAICLANRAAAYPLHGKQKNARVALVDGEEAEKYKPGYAKSYIRQGAAHEALNDTKKAKESLKRGVKVSQLRNNAG